jgi:hypothetical protein
VDISDRDLAKRPPKESLYRDLAERLLIKSLHRDLAQTPCIERALAKIVPKGLLQRSC